MYHPEVTQQLMHSLLLCNDLKSLFVSIMTVHVLDIMQHVDEDETTFSDAVFAQGDYFMSNVWFTLPMYPKV